MTPHTQHVIDDLILTRKDALNTTRTLNGLNTTIVLFILILWGLQLAEFIFIPACNQWVSTLIFTVAFYGLLITETVIYKEKKFDDALEFWKEDCEHNIEYADKL